jgi:hypothetical protein
VRERFRIVLGESRALIRAAEGRLEVRPESWLPELVQEWCRVYEKIARSCRGLCSPGEESVGIIEWCIGIVPRAYFRPRRYMCTAGSAFAAVRPVDWHGAAGTVTAIPVNRWRRGRRYLYRRRVIGGRISTEVLPRREFVPTRRSRYYSTAFRGTARHTPFRCDADMSKGFLK